MLLQFANLLNPRRSLAAKLMLAIIAISLVLSLLISLLMGKAAEMQAERDIGELHAEYAQQLADKLDAELYTHQQDVIIFAGLIRSLPTDVKDQRMLLEQMQTAYPEYAWLGVVDLHGKVLAATHRLLEGQDVSQRPWFMRAKTQPYVGDMHEVASLAATLPTVPNEEPLRFLDIAVPVKDAQGNTVGVLGSHLSWSWVREIQREILAPLQLRRTIEALIVAKYGQVLLGPADLIGTSPNLAHVTPPASPTNASNGYQVARWADGKDYLAGFAHGDGQGEFTGLGWTIVVRESTATAFADATQLQQSLLLFGAGLGLVFAGLGTWLMRRFTQPLNQIAATADRIQQADFIQQTELVDIPIFSGADEVARVSRSLHNLVNTLEERVKERTQDVLRLSEENKQVAVTRERLRMARDLHDTLAHTLAGLLTEIRLLRKMAHVNPDIIVLQQELTHAEDAAKIGLKEARAAITNLRSNPVREMGLEAALHQAAKHFEQHAGIATTFETEGTLPLLQDSRAETVYRIVEEALHNIERHADAAHVRLGLSAVKHNGKLQTTVEIVDDGVGFDVRKPVEGHYGLRGMREQAEVIAATFMVQSALGQGTQIRVTLN